MGLCTPFGERLELWYFKISKISNNNKFTFTVCVCRVTCVKNMYESDVQMTERKVGA